MLVVCSATVAGAEVPAAPTPGHFPGGATVADATATVEGPTNASGVNTLAATAGGGAASSEWPTAGHEANRSGHTTNSTGPTSDPDIRWLHEFTDDVSDVSVRKAGDLVYVVGQSSIRAVDNDTGELVWNRSNVEVDQYVIAGDVLVVNDNGYKGDLRALNATTGTDVWTRSDVTRDGLVVHDGVLYTTGSYWSNSKLYAVDLATGSDIWDEQFSMDELTGGLSASGDTIYATGKETDRDHAVWALNDSDGSEQWRFEMEGEVTMRAVATGTDVYVGAGTTDYDPKFYRLNATDGHVEWVFDVNAPPAGAAVTDDSVLLASGNSIRALDTATGTEQWRYRFQGSIEYGLHYRSIDTHAPSVANGTVYAANDRGYVVALNATTGTELWEERLAGVTSRPAVADDRVYVQAKDTTDTNTDYTRVYALETKPFEFTGFTTSTTTVAPGETVTANVTVENLDTENRTYNLSLLADPPLPVDAWALDQQNGTLTPGETRTLTFSGQLNTSGDWNLSVRRHLESDSSTDPVTVTVAHDSRDDDWSFVGFDPGRTRSNPDTFGPKQHLQEVWNLTAHDDHVDPVIADGLVFAVREPRADGKTTDLLGAYTEATGEKQWEFNVSAENRRLAGSPTYDGGVVYLYTTPYNWDGSGNVYDGTVFAVNATDGSLDWRHDTTINYSGLSPDQAPVVNDGTVYVSGSRRNPSGDVNGSVLALHATNGTIDWHYTVNSDQKRNTYPLAIANGTLVFATNEQDDQDPNHWETHLRALDAASGVQQWSTTTYDLDLQRAPVVTNDTIYVVNESVNGAGEQAETLFALDLADGSERWEFVPDDVSDQVDDWDIYAPTVTDSAVYLRQTMRHSSAPRPSQLYALDPDTGARLWNRSTLELGTRFHVDGLIYAGDAYGDYTYLYDAATGEYYSSSDLLSRERGPVRAIANGTMITYADSTGPYDFRVVREGGIIEYSNLAVDSHVSGIGENVSVSATVTNSGDYERDYTVLLDTAPDDISHRYYWDGNQRQGTLAPGESETISWNVLLKERGDTVFFLVPADDQYMVRHMYDRAGSVTVNVGDDRDGTVLDLGGPRTTAPDATSWPTSDYDPANTGNNTATDAADTVGSGAVNWSVNHSYEWTTAPTIANDTLYVGGITDTGAESVFAYNTTDGSLRWSYVTTSTRDVETAPTYANGYLYTVASDGRVYQFDAATGERLWTFHAGDDGGIAVVDDILYVTGTEDNVDAVFAINATTRERLWTFTRPDGASTNGYRGSPAVANGMVYVINNDEQTYALYATNGTPRWSRDIAGQSLRLHSPTVGDGLVFVDDTTYSSTNANLYALNASDGTTEWSTGANVDGYTGSSPALADDTLYFTADGAMRAVNASSGTERWSTTICSAARSSPAVANGIVYVPLTDGTVRAFDTTTGALVWRYSAYYEYGFTPAAADGRVFVTGLEDPDNVYPLLALDGGQNSTPKTLFTYYGLSVSSTDVATGESITVEATVKNQGDAACEYAADLKVDGSVEDTTPGTVGTGSSTATASFTHSFSSTGTYDVTIEDLSPIQVNVTAPEPNVDVSPSSHDFGSVNVSEYDYVDVAVSNTGQADLEWTDSRLASGDTSDFSIPSDPADTYDSLWPGATKYVRVYFTPQSGGSKTTTLEIVTNDTSNPTLSVSLTGEGVDGQPDISTDPATLEFGDVPATTRVTKSVTVANDGDGDLTISGSSVSGTGFGIENGGGATTVASGANHTIDVTFSPTSTGSHTGTLSISSDDPDTPTATVSLAGNATPPPAPAFAVNRTSWFFEAVPVDTTATTAFEISNTGDAPLNVTGATVSGNNSSSFTVATSTPLVVQPGNSATLDVEFAPTSLGTHDATLELTHNDTDASPTTISLGGGVIDQTTPTVTITDVNGTTVNAGTVYANETVTMNGTASDRHGTIDSVTVALVSTFTTYVHTTAAAHDAGTGNWSATIDLSQVVDDGDYTVRAGAEDDSANTNTTTASATVRVDREAPQLATVLDRIDASNARVNVTTQDTIQDDTLSVHVERPDGSTIPVSLSKTGSKWSGTVSLAGDGQYNASATALDRAGNEGTANASTVFQTQSTDANNTITVKVEPSNLFVEFTTSQSVNDTFITMTSSTTPLAPLVRGNAGVNFIDALLGQQLTENLTYATIGIPIDPALLPSGTGVDDVTIRYYNETTSQWEDVPTTRQQVTLRDGTSGEYWLANVTHFSTYGAVAADTTPPTVTGTTPSTGHEYAAGTNSATIEVDYTDAASGVNASAVTVSFDGGDVTRASATSITSTGVRYAAAGLTNGSSHTLDVTIEDHAGNTVTESVAFDVATPTSGSSNSGTNASSPSSPSPPSTPSNTDDSPVEPAVTVDTVTDGVFAATITDARADDQVTFTFADQAPTAGGVTLDALDVGTAADGDYTFRVSATTDCPAETGAFSAGTPLVYVNISHPDVPDANIANATFHLTVSRNRLDETGTDASDLAVYRFTDDDWVALETTIVETTTTSVVLEAASPGLSVFAVGARQSAQDTTTAAPQTTAVPTTSAPPTTTASTSAPTTPTASAADRDDVDGADSGTSPTALVLIGLLTLLAAVAAVLHRRRT